MLVRPTLQAAKALGVQRIVLSGGVAANSRLRTKMKEEAEAAGKEVFCPAPKFCTDNGAMIALAGYYSLRRGRRDDFCLNADADLTL
jgi:N6-L-threonylcarbamoyladenine synthase